MHHHTRRAASRLTSHFFIDLLVQALHQLAGAAPDLVYGHTADMLALGADIHAQVEVLRRIGFRHRSIAAD